MEKQWQELLDLLKKLDPNLDIQEVNHLLLKGLKHKQEKDSVCSLLEKLGSQNELKGLVEKLKKLAPQNDMQQFYTTLKKLGFQTEYKLNEQIQNNLNKKEIVQLLHKHAHIITPLVQGLRELVETLSVPLNIPTKNDVANVAKLTLQNEEKLDSIEEQLIILNQYLKQLISGDVPTYKKTKEEKLDPQELKLLKKMKLLSHILESTSNQLKRKE